MFKFCYFLLGGSTYIIFALFRDIWVYFLKMRFCNFDQFKARVMTIHKLKLQ